MLREEQRSAPAQSDEWDCSGGDGEVVGTADELKRRGRLEVAVQRKRVFPAFALPLPSLHYG